MSYRVRRVCAVIAFFAAVAPVNASAQPADLVLTGGNVITVDAVWRTAEAVAIRGGRFVAIGTSAEIAKEIGPETTVIKLGGQTVVPGLIDTHLLD